MIVNRELLKEFRQNSNSQIIYVLLTSLGAYGALLYVGYLLSGYSYWWVLFLAVPTHWLHARIFILMHDCGHYSFFKQRWLNTLFGHIAGLFYLTPFLMWRELHNKHHVMQGNLQKRGYSLDVWTMTSDEYSNASDWKKWRYRFYRHPFTVLVLSPLLLFILIFRIPFEKFSTKAVLNIFILDILLLLPLVVNPDSFFKMASIVAPSMLISFCMASFLFYVQHQFENTLWLIDSEYSNEQISLRGSSYFKMPPFFDWCYGYIGYHHIHHLDTKIPMYKLQSAQIRLNLQTEEITFEKALNSLKCKLWDSSLNKLTGF